MKLKDWDGEQLDVVINADMNDVFCKIKNIGKIKLDLVVTSPPYGVGQIPQKKGTDKRRVKTINQEYDEVDDQFSDADYGAWLKLINDYSPLTFWNVPAKQNRPFGTDEVKPFGQIVWAKPFGIPFATKGVIYFHENIWLVGDHKRLKSTPSVWTIPGQRFSKHPAPFPVQIAAKAIHHGSKPGDLVMDPFGGSGTVAATAKAMGRRFITCDVSEEYCGWMEQRIKETKVLKGTDYERTSSADNGTTPNSKKESGSKPTSRRRIQEPRKAP